jgi:hypothetical protein
VQLDTLCGTGIEQFVTQTSYDYTGLDQSTMYSWRVQAQDSCGQRGAYASCFTFKTKALTGIDRYYIPSGLTYTQGDMAVTIPIYAENLNPLREFDLNVRIDPAVFEYIGWSLADTRAQGASTVNVTYDPNMGRFQAQHVVDPPNGQCPPSIPAGDGLIFKILARVRLTAGPGRTPITLLSSSPNRFIGCDGRNVTPSVFPDSADIRSNITAVRSGEAGYPAEFSLSTPRPNPMSGTSVFTFGLTSRQPVQVRVFDIRGRTVANLLDEDESAGWHTVRWDGHDRLGRTVPAGVYFVRLHGTDQSRTRRVIVVR